MSKHSSCFCKSSFSSSHYLLTITFSVHECILRLLWDNESTVICLVETYNTVIVIDKIQRFSQSCFPSLQSSLDMLKKQCIVYSFLLAIIGETVLTIQSIKTTLGRQSNCLIPVNPLKYFSVSKCLLLKV